MKTIDCLSKVRGGQACAEVNHAVPIAREHERGNEQADLVKLALGAGGDHGRTAKLRPRSVEERTDFAESEPTGKVLHADRQLTSCPPLTDLV